MYLQSLNYFRAIAIVLIVAGHSHLISGVHFTTIGTQVFANLLIGGTSLFVFISGFLFHHIFLPRYKFSKFMTGKIKNVFIPYIFLSIPIIYFLLTTNTGWKPFFMPNGYGVTNKYIIPITKYFLTEDTIIAYWYIPFVMVTFLMAPLHVLFIKKKTSIQLITLLLLALAAIMHRPVGNLNVLQSVIYFLPVYLFGIFCSINKDMIYAIFKEKELYLLLLAVALAVIQVLIGHVGNYHKPPFDIQDIDIMLFQKILLSLFFMVWLHRFEGTSHQLLDSVAAKSFTIFFLHGYILFTLQRVLSHMQFNDLAAIFNDGSYISWIIWMITVAMIVFISMYIAFVVKFVAAKNSRYLIGY
tara:strand:- start:96 stop:1163 length:1068 start_codon:yes stop_codon:yes gene_type:complete